MCARVWLRRRCFVEFRKFCAAGKLVPHEELREAGHLKIVDTFDELVRSLFAESLEKGASFKLEPGHARIELPPSPPTGPPGKLEC